MQQLLPVGITDVRDMPHTFFHAIKAALAFLSFEELPKEERPPKRIWLDNRALEGWFERVEKLREERYSGQGIDGPTVQNAGATALIVE